MSAEAPSRLPADIAASATRLKGLVDEMRTALQELREKERGCDAASGPLITARMALVGMASEVEQLQVLIRVGRLTEVGVVESAFVAADKLELHPRNLPSDDDRQMRLFRRSLHAASDHTLDDDEEEAQ